MKKHTCETGEQLPAEAARAERREVVCECGRISEYERPIPRGSGSPSFFRRLTSHWLDSARTSRPGRTPSGSDSSL
jgi:hypothetical protein